jgi:hypothetical protein
MKVAGAKFKEDAFRTGGLAVMMGRVLTSIDDNDYHFRGEGVISQGKIVPCQLI